MNDPLELPLRDIHLPESVAFWPLAYGWWILVFMIIAMIALTVFFYLRTRRNRLSAITMARHECSRINNEYQEHNDALRLVKQVSILMRRLSISLFPRTQVASLTGDEWLRFLDEQIPGPVFIAAKGSVLIDAPYREKINRDDAEELMNNCELWIDAVSKKEGLKP